MQLRRPVRVELLQVLRIELQPLGLKKLIATCYSGSPIAGSEYQPSLFDDDVDENTGRHRRAYKAVVNVFRDTTGDGVLDMDDIRNLLDSGENELTELHGDGTYGAGDFRSRRRLELPDVRGVRPAESREAHLQGVRDGRRPRHRMEPRRGDLK